MVANPGGKPTDTTIQVKGPAGLVVIDKSQLEVWEAKGYEVWDKDAPTTTPDDDTPNELLNHTVDELRSFAGDNDVELPASGTKAVLVEEIAKAGYNEADFVAWSEGE